MSDAIEVYETYFECIGPGRERTKSGSVEDAIRHGHVL
jgi:hypothetical protein